MPTLTKLYTMQEASEHNTKDDCWVVIDGKVRLLCFSCFDLFASCSVVNWTIRSGFVQMCF